MTSREEKLAQDFVKCKQNLIIAEHKFENKACSRVNSSSTHLTTTKMASVNSGNTCNRINLQALGNERLIDDMIETAVYDDKIFDVKKEDGGIKIKKLLKTPGYVSFVSFPKSQSITSFTVINKSDSAGITTAFINPPYTNISVNPSEASHYIVVNSEDKRITGGRR